MTFFAGIGVALGILLFPNDVVSFITTPVTQSNGLSFQRVTLSPASSRRSPHRQGGSNEGLTSTSLPMVFDFFKERASEGVEQLSKFSDSAKRGNLGDALKDVASYTQETNKAFASGLAKSRTRFLYDIDNMVNNKGKDYLEDLEMVLLQSDLGIRTTDEILEEVKSFRYEGRKFLSKKDLLATIRGKLLEALNVATEVPVESSVTPLTRQVRFANPDAADINQRLTVLFLMGANGMGKTTTIGKLAHRLRTEGDQKVLMAACDTFRAGAVEQLEQWGTRAEVEVFTPSESAKSPSAVLYGALDKALKENYDTLLVDTSGRLSNNDALTRELVKMKGVIQKRMSLENQTVEKADGTVSTVPKPNMDVPHETLLVIDAAQGRMALDSARQWNEDVGLTGLILTKLDGSARGGSVVAVSRELKLPVKLVGVGESIDALKDVSRL
jgi:fused signal recognition particle receptor